MCRAENTIRAAGNAQPNSCIQSYEPNPAKAKIATLTAAVISRPT